MERDESAPSATIFVVIGALRVKSNSLVLIQIYFQGLLQPVWTGSSTGSQKYITGFIQASISKIQGLFKDFSRKLV